MPATDTLDVPASSRRERTGWYFYDWAISAFSTTVITVFLGPFLTSVTEQAAGCALGADCDTGVVRPLGITLDIVPTDDLGGTTSSGDYDLIVFAWVQTPASFSNAEQTWNSTSSSNYGKYNNPEVDRLMHEAATSTDLAAARDTLNEAGRILAEDSYVLPLYQKPTIIAAQDDVANVRNNSSLDGPTYNVEEWGLRPAG